MGLFDEPEEKTASGDTAFDNDSKIRLFETQQREERGVHEHLKRFVPVAVVAVIVVAAVIYFMQPGIGDTVKPPKETEDAVYDYMLSKEKRSVREITFYQCDGYYWVKILAEPRSSLASVDDPANQFRLSVRESGAGREILTLQTTDKANDVPCNTN